MKHIQIKDGSKIWRPSEMKAALQDACAEKYDNPFPEVVLNTPYSMLYLEWWLHNIGYCLTRGADSAMWIRVCNRCRDIDFVERR